MRGAAFWDKKAEQYDAAIRKHDPPFDKTIARSRALLGSSDVVLDLGCGSGEFCVELAPSVQKIHGIDTSAGMIELARQKARDRRLDNATFDQGDLNDCDHPAGAFSAVIAFSILHLVDDAGIVLTGLGKLMKSGGLLISETPCLFDKNWLIRRLLVLTQKMGLIPTVRYFSSPELESLVSANGFEILESEAWDPKSLSRWIVARKI